MSGSRRSAERDMSDRRYRHEHRGHEERERDYRDRNYTRKDDRGYSHSRRNRSGDRDKAGGYGYGARERERERERDRERYGRSARDREGRHRSASPRRPNRSKSRASRSRSPSDDEKRKPNFAPSGLLAAETNTVKAADGTSTVLKYNEPPEARKPALGWRLYVFKDTAEPDLLHIYRQSAYLVGRDRLVADIALDHPSCSKQHAAIQYRYVQEKDEFGTSKGSVKPFIIDLESTNGTIVNDQTIPTARYYELKAGDVIKFGLSTKEYVLLHDEAS
ncbi:hypothetical protein CVT24_010943 [Panaeolus cyanescens]|uniref:FHA domain-containing protein n=1 Tax=Panaeolus cyanescens TaxID=181874 RepID=A0A409YVQ3_9AGAR|nr:hypothetical protein CVT24_010943 [Panaeolus cyanescens]